MSRQDKHNAGRVLLDIAVEIADGVVEHIEMLEGESAEEVAKRFCTKFKLPNRFIAPLTQHIVTNLLSIIEDDNEDIEFQHDAGPSSRPSSAQSAHNGPASVRSDPGFRRGEHVSRSQDRPDTSASETSSSKKYDRRFSERIHSHTHSSNSKTLAEREAERKRGLRRQSSLNDPVSEKAKTIYMRLYTEYMTQKKRQEEVRRKSEIIFRTQVAKDPSFISKYSFWLMRKRGRKALQFKNYGELLYEEGLDLLSQRKKMVEQKKKEDAAKETEGMTWTPKISKHSHQLKLDQPQYWLRLNAPDPIIKQNVNNLRKELWEHELMECTFKPQVNPHDDEQQTPGDTGTGSRFDQLFLDAENRIKRHAEYAHCFPRYPFRPTINRRRQKVSSPSGSTQDGTVFDRLVQYASKFAEKRKEREAQMRNRVDPVTGQQYFKPRIGRKPHIPWNSNSLPIGTFLHQLKNSIDSRKKELADMEALRKKQARHVHYVGHNSQKIVEKLKHRNLQEIFEHLDNDKDGVVELESADFRRLSAEVILDLDVVKKMGAAQRKLSFKDFSKLMLDCQSDTTAEEVLDVHANPLLFYKSICEPVSCLRVSTSLLTPSSPNAVQKHRGRRGSHACGRLVRDHGLDWSEHQHPWKMSQQSRNMAARKRHYGSRRQWYRLLLADKDRRLAKIETLRKEVQNQEMAECTFRPELFGWKKNKGIPKKDVAQSRAMAGKGLAETPHSTVVERDQQEVHGFIFQEARAGGEAASSSHSVPPAVEHNRSSNGVEVPSTSMGLLESLRLLVAKSREAPAGEVSAGTVHEDDPTGLGFLRDLQF